VLRGLCLDDEEQFIAAWGRSGDFSAYRPGMPFAEFLESIEDAAAGRNLPRGHVPSTLRIGDVSGTIAGRLSIRHHLNRFLETAGGHIGYSVLERHRRQGYGREMLRQAIPLAAAIGLPRVLVTCDVTNVASRKIIEANGGIFESTYERGLRIPKLRYWIDTANPESTPLPRQPP
jgi:predicted acetyltransferase